MLTSTQRGMPVFTPFLHLLHWLRSLIQSLNMTTRPDPRLAALPMETTPELSSAFQTYVKVLGFIPNSMLIMQRKPKIVQALSQLAAAIWDPASEVPVAFKRLLAHVASRAHGCSY